VGLVFQQPERQLFNMTVAEEIAFGLEGRALPPQQIGQRVADTLASVGLSGLEQRAPWQLSGGQQKRLAIASILAMQPPILVLDEPMAGLDPAGRREIAALLAELKRSTGATVIVMEKDAEFVARWAERVVVMAQGQIALDGAPDAVFQQDRPAARPGSGRAAVGRAGRAAQGRGGKKSPS
jgi:energy-coupling factor transporter ATP-binding protein EcfA2